MMSHRSHLNLWMRSFVLVFSLFTERFSVAFPIFTPCCVTSKTIRTELTVHNSFKNSSQDIHIRERSSFLSLYASKDNISDSKIDTTASSSGNNAMISTTTNPNTNTPMMKFPIFTLVLPLLAVYISNQWSRSSIYYLVDFSSTATASAFNAINLDIGFTQSQYGILASVGFTALFAIASLFAGNIADRYNRKTITMISATLWSMATVATALSTTYEQILAARIMMGLVCAFCTPSAYTLIRDFVKSDRISLANSIYGSGVYFGGGLSSLSILLDQRIGWRDTCLAIALYGGITVLACSILLPFDSKVSTDIVASKNSSISIRSSNSPSPTVSPSTTIFPNPLEGVVEILTTNARIQWLFMASFFRFCSGLMIGVWAAPYYKGAFPDDASSYAVINAFIVGLCGVTSGIVGGYLADQSSKTKYTGLWKDTNAGRLVVPIVGTTLAIPTWWMTVHSSSFEGAMIWLAIEYLVAECWFGPTVAVLQSEVKKQLGGTAQGLFTLTGAIGNFAPTILGFIYSREILHSIDSTANNSQLLSTLLANGVCVCYLISVVCFILSASSSSSQQVDLKSKQV